ncbi:MAG TPA: tripartite tricarboxylate transporter substrate-binding protein [Alphaproteobacteria bacterium]|nr:tripartite tricarboxylate transporter substrate-binding protein [Alphaproteobacteria bacterium]
MLAITRVTARLSRVGARLSGLALGAMALCAMALCPAPAAAEFKISSITVSIGSGTGGGYDTYGRLTARHLGRFLPGNPTLIAKNQPGAGGVVLANAMYNVAPKDGSAIAILQAGTPFEPLFGNAQAKFDPQKFNWLVSLNRLVNIGVFWHTSRIQKMEDLLTGEAIVGSSGGGNASTEVYPNLLNNLAGTKFKVIAGYKGTGDTALAMERGEVEGIVGWELSSLRANKPDWIRDKKANIVIQVSLTKSDDLPDVPTVIDLVKNPDDKRIVELLLARQEHGRVFLAPPGTPADIVATYRTSFLAMAKDKAFRDDAERLHADIAVNTGEEVAALLARTYNAPKPLVERAIAEFKKAGGGE